jgi:hypothetical protein
MESRNRVALRATLHCLTGCSIGEIAEMALGGELRLGSGATVALSTAPRAGHH